MECVSKYMASENTCKEHHTGVLQYATKIIEGCRGSCEILDIFRKRIGKISLPAKYWKNITVSGVTAVTGEFRGGKSQEQNCTT